MPDEVFTFDEGWIRCTCGERVYVILKETETYPCRLLDSLKLKLTNCTETKG